MVKSGACGDGKNPTRLFTVLVPMLDFARCQSSHFPAVRDESTAVQRLPTSTNVGVEGTSQ